MFHSGECESFKAQYHAVLGGMLFGAFLYNAVAFALRGDRHLGINALIYGAGVVLEREQVKHHRERLS